MTRTCSPSPPWLRRDLSSRNRHSGKRTTRSSQGEFRNVVQAEAQKHFNPPMLYRIRLVSASQQAFEDTLNADPECGIAHWGIALSRLLNPHVPPPAKNIARAPWPSRRAKASAQDAA